MSNQPMRLGVLGGGQLAQLLCEAATALKVETLVLSPDPEAPARRACTEFIQADLEDPAALQRLADECTVVTLDHEHVPLGSLSTLERGASVYPGHDVMQRLNDRLAQRTMLVQLGLPQPPFWPVGNDVDLQAAQRSATFPAVLKARFGGYDGYGQVRVRQAEELPAAWEKLQRSPCVMEAWVANVREFSIVGARGADGTLRQYEPIANIHAGGQLQLSQAPLELPGSLAEQAAQAWSTIAEALPLRGVMAVEFFIDEDDRLMINEIAPRVHNSGHLTQMAYACSQFELHVRAVLGLPLPELELARPAVMLNLYPEHGIVDAEQAERARERVGGQLVWYGKSPRPRRKMGHWLLPPEHSEKAQALLAQKSV